MANFDELKNILYDVGDLVLREICREVKIDHGRLSGDNHAAKAFSLIERMETENRLDELETALRLRFPKRFLSSNLAEGVDLKNKLYSDICGLDDSQWQALLVSRGFKEESIPGDERAAKALELIKRLDGWLHLLEKDVRELVERKTREDAEKKQAMRVRLTEQSVSARERITIGESLLSSDPHDQVVRSCTARAYWDYAGDYSSTTLRAWAIEKLTRAIELDPQGEYYGQRGVDYAVTGDYEQALSDCNRAVEISPKQAKCYFFRASVYNGKGNHTQAMADITQAIALDPQNASYYGDRCRIYREIGDTRLALADIRQAIALDPQQELKEYYSLAIELDPEEAAYYKGRGEVYSQKRNYDQAVSDYTKAIELDPKCAECYAWRGGVYSQKRNYDQAISDYTKAIELDPKCAEYYAWRGEVYYHKEDYDQAVSDYTNAITHDPQQADFYWWRAISYEKTENYTKATDNYARAEDLNPQMIGYYYIQRNRSTGEVMHGIDLYPQHAYSGYLTLINRAKGGNDQLIAEVTAVIERHQQDGAQENGAFYYIRGLVYKDKGYRYQALLDLRRAARLGFTDAQQELDSL